MIHRAILLWTYILFYRQVLWQLCRLVSTFLHPFFCPFPNSYRFKYISEYISYYFQITMINDRAWKKDSKSVTQKIFTTFRNLFPIVSHNCYLCFQIYWKSLLSTFHIVKDLILYFMVHLELIWAICKGHMWLIKVNLIRTYFLCAVFMHL